MIENDIMLEENLATFSEIDKLAVAAQQTRRMAARSARTVKTRSGIP